MFKHDFCNIAVKIEVVRVRVACEDFVAIVIVIIDFFPSVELWAASDVELGNIHAHDAECGKLSAAVDVEPLKRIVIAVTFFEC